MTTHLTYHGFHRPVRKILADLARAESLWTHTPDGSWSGNVEYAASDGTRSATFPVREIRLNTGAAARHDGTARAG
ncbi:MAG: hypothetical protein M3467_03330 [Actinomycetota bacterium]|nr:hypothetical protein [Actinomycetota bacterium]